MQHFCIVYESRVGEILMYLSICRQLHIIKLQSLLFQSHCHLNSLNIRWPSSSLSLARTDSCLPLDWLQHSVRLRVAASNDSWWTYSRSWYFVCNRNLAAQSFRTVSLRLVVNTRSDALSHIWPLQLASRLTGCVLSCCLFTLPCKWSRRGNICDCGRTPHRATVFFNCCTLHEQIIADKYCMSGLMTVFMCIPHQTHAICRTQCSICMLHVGHVARRSESRNFSGPQGKEDSALGRRAEGSYPRNMQLEKIKYIGHKQPKTAMHNLVISNEDCGFFECGKKTDFSAAQKARIRRQVRESCLVRGRMSNSCPLLIHSEQLSEQDERAGPISVSWGCLGWRPIFCFDASRRWPPSSPRVSDREVSSWGVVIDALFSPPAPTLSRGKEYGTLSWISR